MSRQSLVERALPAAPASALHAATKGYLDGLHPEDLVGADAAFAYYINNGATQSCPNNTDTWVAFPDAVTTHALVTRSTLSPGHQFTFGATGVWAITMTARFVSGGGTGERYLGLWSDTKGTDDVIQAWGEVGLTNPQTMCVTYVGKFTSGKHVMGRVYQNSGASLNLEGEAVWIQMTLMRKYS